MNFNAVVSCAPCGCPSVGLLHPDGRFLNRGAYESWDDAMSVARLTVDFANHALKVEGSVSDEHIDQCHRNAERAVRP